MDKLHAKKEAKRTTTHVARQCDENPAEALSGGGANAEIVRVAAFLCFCAVEFGAGNQCHNAIDQNC